MSTSPPPPAAARSRPTTPARPRTRRSTPTPCAPRGRAGSPTSASTATRIDACYGRQRGPQLVTDEDRRELFGLMGSAEGVTEFASTFDRRDVAPVRGRMGRRPPRRRGDRGAGRHLADHARHRPPRARAPRRPHRRRHPPPGRPQRGRRRGRGALHDPAHAGHRGPDRRRLRAGPPHRRRRGAGGRRSTQWLARRGHLGDDQVEMVRSITSSGQRIQLVYGPAGAGKTTALEAAARAWEIGRLQGHRRRRAGHRQRDRRRQGQHRQRHGGQHPVAHRRRRHQLRRPARWSWSTSAPRWATATSADLAHQSERRGFILRLVGDPAQHTAVAAGGAWRRLLDAYPEDRAELDHVRRQKGDGDGRRAPGPGRLAGGQTSTPPSTASTAAAASSCRQPRRPVSPRWSPTGTATASADRPTPSLALVDDHRAPPRSPGAQRPGPGPAGRPTARCTVPSCRPGELQFQAGDEVIALQQDRDLQPDGARRRGEFVQTGGAGRGRRASTCPSAATRARWSSTSPAGAGSWCPWSTSPAASTAASSGALAHSYALTTHAAQGDTYDAARPIATDASSAKGVYVGATRGEHDLRLYVVLERDLDPSPTEHPEMPRLEPT